MKFIFFGAGYCSRFILPKLDSSSKIICTHNLEIKEQAFDKDLKIKRLTFSEFLKKKDNFFRGTTHILNSIPPLKNNDLIYDLLKNSKNKVFKDLKWFGYFSSTSVYGDHSGHWVDEETKIKPSSIFLSFSLQSLFTASSSIGLQPNPHTPSVGYAMTNP